MQPSGAYIRSGWMTAAPSTREGQQARHVHSPTGYGYSSHGVLTLLVTPCSTRLDLRDVVSAPSHRSGLLPLPLLGGGEVFDGTRLLPEELILIAKQSRAGGKGSAPSCCF